MCGILQSADLLLILQYNMRKYIFYISLAACLLCGSMVASAHSLPDETVASQRMDTDIASVSASSTGITLSVKGEKAERFYVFSITGQLVKTIDVDAAGVRTVELPRGCYIVKCSHWSKKVMVK